MSAHDWRSLSMPPRTIKAVLDLLDEALGGILSAEQRRRLAYARVLLAAASGMEIEPEPEPEPEP